MHLEPTVLVRFWLGGLLFHGALVALSLLLVRRWARRLGPDGSLDGWPRAAAADAALWSLAALTLAGLAASLGANGFIAVRLLSQALFAELVALSAWIAALLWRRGLRPGAVAATLAAASLLGTYAHAYHREPTDLQVRRYALDLSAGGAPRGRVVILHLTDIQADQVGEYEERALATAAAQPADLVLLTGDYAQPRIGQRRARATDEVNRLLRRVRFRAPLGAFAVRGDVDADWPRVLAGTSIRPLAGETVTLPLPGGARLALVGLTPRMSHARDREGLLRLVRTVPGDAVRVVFGHGPDFVSELAAEAPVDLALAGHTHGGQVVLPWVGAPYTKTRLPRRFASGLHDYGGIPLHVSAGIGMEQGAAPQIRFLCPPELSLLEIRY